MKKWFLALESITSQAYGLSKLNSNCRAVLNELSNAFSKMQLRTSREVSLFGRKCKICESDNDAGSLENEICLDIIPSNYNNIYDYMDDKDYTPGIYFGFDSDGYFDFVVSQGCGETGCFIKLYGTIADFNTFETEEINISSANWKGPIIPE